jgi:hypothetical protein
MICSGCHAGVSSFQQPSDSSRKLLMDSKTVTFKGKKFAIDPLLRPATLQLCLLLVRACVPPCTHACPPCTRAPHAANHGTSWGRTDASMTTCTAFGKIGASSSLSSLVGPR